MRIVTALLCLALAACAQTGAVAPQAPPSSPPPPRLEVVITPDVENGEVAAISVSLRVESPNVQAGGALLRLPLVFAATPTARYGADAIVAEDEAGALELAAEDDPVDPNNSIYFRRYRASRATRGDVRVRFTALGSLFGPRATVGPPFNLMRQDGGFSGAGVSFIAVPDTKQVYRIAMRWNLEEMGASARGVWSMGEGSVDTVGPVEIVQYAYYMAGPALRSHPAEGAGNFGIYWMGEPDFDIESIGSWISRAHAAMASFYNSQGRPFRVFLRENPGAAHGGGGAGLVNSFMAGYGEHEKVTVEGMRSLLAHEMVHNWPGGLEGPVGEASWYGEGMAEYYDPQLTFRAGLLTPDEFIADANERARGYYTNALNRLPAEEISALFWRDARARTLPYQRGSLYLAQVDAEIRRRSNGERSLDDLALAMLARREAGGSYDRAAWIELLRGELGDEAVTGFEAMMAGGLVAPPSDAFGPCFRRVETAYRTFDLGFEPQLLSLNPRRISGLQAGSRAERAGLRNGDVVLNEVPVETLREEDDPVVHLRVQRDGRAFDISYPARGEAAQGYRWERVADIADGACNVWGVLPRR